MVLVILGHLLYGSSMAIVNKTIYSFHMPLFFLLAGYVQKNHIEKGFIKKKAKKILIPYFAFIICWIPIYGLKVMEKQLGVADVFYDAFYVKGAISNNPLWFLIVLFEIFLFVRLTGLPGWKMKFQIMAWGGFALYGWLIYFCSEQFGFLKVFGLNRAVVCMSFFILGIIFRRMEEQVEKVNKYVVVVISLFTNILLGTFINGKVSIYGFEFGSYVCFQIAAVTGAMVVIYICRQFFDRECFLSKLSKYAILLLGIQYFIIRPFNKIMDMTHMMGTQWYDAFMLLIVLFCIFFIPAVYEWLQKYIPIIKLLNGEYNNESRKSGKNHRI